MSILRNLLRPYKALFSNSDEKPKEVNIEPTKMNKETASPKETEPVIKPEKPRAGKILWKKKK